MDSSNVFSMIETLEPRLLLSAGWTTSEFARFYGNPNPGYGPDSDIVVRVTSSDTYITVGGMSTEGNSWLSNDFMVKTSGSEKRILTNSDEDGTAPSLVETPGGNLRAIWYNTTDQSLMFAAEGDSSWSSNSPRTLASGNVGEWSDMALESDGDLHVVYYDRGNGQIKYAYHAVADGWNTWTHETLDTVGAIAAGLDMAEVVAVAVDSSGAPHVAYYGADETQLEYAYRTGADTWVNAVLDSDGDVGSHPSIAIDGADVVHLVYYDISDRTLRYDTRTAAGWTGTQVVEGVTGTARPQGGNSLALDALGNPHIAYTYTQSNNAKNLKHAWIDTDWTNETVDTTNQHGYYPSMVITQAGDGYISYGMNYTQSIYVAEKAGIGEPGGPDLTVSVSDAGGRLYVPGDVVTSEVVITNIGIEPAVGDVRLEAGVGFDTGSGFEYDIAYDRYVSVDLDPGESMTVVYSQRVPNDASPIDIFQVATIDPEVEVGDTVPGNNEWQASVADEVIWAVGDIDGRTLRTLTVEDEDGDRITLKLAGAGSMSITPGASGIGEIVITGTNDRSAIKIIVKGADGESFVENLIVEGDVGKIIAPDIFITGDVTIGGFCRTLVLGTVDVGHVITINDDQIPVDPADLKRNAVTLIFADVVGTTVNTNGLAIKSITAIDWNDGNITAPWIGSIKITGTRNGAFAGDLDVNMTLSGVGSPRQTLGKVMVAGAIVDGLWDITGDVGVVQAAGTDEWILDVHSNLKSLNIKGAAIDTQVNVDGLVGSIRAAEWDSGQISADQLKKLMITGSKKLGLDGNCKMVILVTGDGVAPGKTAVGNVTINGEADDLQMTVGGLIGPIRVAQWSDGGITADGLKKLTITGSKKLGLDGDCDMFVYISGVGVGAGKAAVGAIVINGNASNLQVDVDGLMGSLFAANVDSGDITVDALKKLKITGSKKLGLPGDCDMTIVVSGDGVDPGKTALGGIQVKGDATLDMTVVGSVGKIQAGYLGADVVVTESIQSIITVDEIVGDYSARRIGSVKTRGDFTAAFDLTQTPDPKLMALGSLKVSGQMIGADIKTAGNIGLIQTGTVSNSSIFAGWDSSTDDNADGVFDLFDVGDAFTHESFIKKITIRSGSGQAFAMHNSNIVASTIRKSYVYGDIQAPGAGAEPFGFACAAYDLMLSKPVGSRATTWKNSEAIQTDDNFVVRLV